ncbi:MAG: SelL-related redox protein [Roseiflexaceae bacterium]
MITQSILLPGMAAPTGQVYDTSGGMLDLASLWFKQPALIFFLRHFGCALCRAHLQAIRDAYADFERRGAAVVAVTFADPQGAAQFKRRQQLPFPVLADPSRQAYRAFGMLEGSLATAAGPDVLLRQLAQALRGNIPYINPLEGHITQLGGTVIVDHGGVVRFAHIANPIYNYTPIERYLAIIDDLAVGARA